MNDWNESKLDRELDELMSDLPEPEDLEQKIIRSINRRIRNVVLKVLLTVLCILLIVFAGIDPLLGSMYLNPCRLNRQPEQTMLNVLRDYYETTHPYREPVSLHAEKTGFAGYALEMQVLDLTQPIAIGKSNVFMDLRFGTYQNPITTDVDLSHRVNRFSETGQSPDAILQKLSELPQSAWVYLSVSDTAPKTLEELCSLPVKTAWIQIYQPRAAFQGGLNLEAVALHTQDDIRSDRTEEELLGIYRRNLQNLLEYPEVWEQFGLCDGRGTVYMGQALKETMEDAKTLTALLSENYCVYGQRDAVIQFLEENSLDSVYVETVRVW